VAQAFVLKMEMMRAAIESGSGPRALACSVRYCACCGLVRCEKAVVTEAFVRGSRTRKRGFSERMSVPAGMQVVEKQPRPSPGEGWTVYRVLELIVEVEAGFCATAGLGCGVSIEGCLVLRIRSAVLSFSGFV
jgi:hypothetical protein